MRQLLFSLFGILLIASGCIYLPSAPGTEKGAPPSITTFDANPETISTGSRAQLSWSVSDARSITIDNGVGSVALRGTRIVVPASTTNYTLTAANQYGTVTATAQVIVSGTAQGPIPQLPTINSFNAAPDVISSGGAATLSWNISNATSASIDPGIGSVNAISGTQNITPAGTTSYILTATNSAGSVTSTAIVTVAGLPPPAGLPVINSFEANPNIITLGSSTSLTWNVSNASQVTVISGGGSMVIVDSVGSINATPAASTTYMLQATNSSGMVSKTISVVVGTLGPPPLGKPDIIIINTAKKETPSGCIIGYTIKNNGPVSAAASVAKLYAEGNYKASSNVPALAAGATYDGDFPGWIYSPLMPHLKIVADANYAIDEADETNNEKSYGLAIAIIYDFVTRASNPEPNVRWSSGAGTLTFGGGIDDPKGFACYRTNINLEDNHNYAKVLETHPQWVDNGYIQGSYKELYNTLGYTVKPGEHFYAEVGFVKNAVNGKVRYKVMIRPEGGANTWIIDTVKSYDGTIKVLDANLTPFAGKKADFILDIETEGSSQQDWAVWSEAQIIR